MIISNETSVNYQSAPDLSTESQEDSGIFRQTLSSASEKNYSGIFSNDFWILPSTTVNSMGEFPDSDFFAEMFADSDLSCPSGDVLCYCSRDGRTLGYLSPNGYSVFYEYAPNSTPENPIMNVSLYNHDTNEAWEGTMNLKNIDPRNASKVEMIVLSAHLTGNPNTFLQASIDFDHPTGKTDWTSLLAKARGEIAASGNEILLEKLEDFMMNLEDFMSEQDETSSDVYHKAQFQQQFAQQQALNQLRFNFA